ncbi:EAL domain-containing protein [Marinobacter vinifirmus]|uniref:cyclic-guanylate-specific phosphodiesterase n=1 Tax=Marinobacter vinifirmus TaxID=355591 RepID=A0A558B5P0_9GAMM|nr:EAL domain-containing protein [Marinobacter vinifirmus]TVT31803.1 MAG: EAL domain-containing protein [Marinobacter vinifirmus]
MTQTPNDLRLQACLLVLFLCGFFAGLVGLVVAMFPMVPVPESLRLSLEGALAVIAGGAAMTAIFFRKRLWQLVLGVVLLFLGGYSLGHNVLAGAEDSGLSLLTGEVRLKTVPAFAVVVLGVVSVVGLASGGGRLVAFLAGCFGLPVGAYAVLEHLRQGITGEAGGFVGGFSLIAGLFCLGFGIALLILAQRDPNKPFLLKRDGVTAGVVAVLGAFLLSVIASWGTHEERHQAAASTVRYYASELEYELKSSVAVIDRLANRWASLDFDVPEMGAGAYFLAVFDVSALLSLDSSVNYHDFEIRIEGVDSPVLQTAMVNHHAEFEVFEYLPVSIPNGPEVVLSATAGPASVLTLRGMLPPALFGFGVLMSYLLVMGRSLLSVQKDQAREIVTAEQRFRSLFTQSPDAVFAFDREGVYQAVNPAAQELVGFTEKDIGVTCYRDVLTSDAISEGDFAVFDTAFRNAVAGHPQGFEVSFKNASGEIRLFDVAFVPTVVDGEVVGVFALTKDVTERHEAQEAQRILQRSLESSDNAVVVVDVRSQDLPVVFANPAFSEMTGYTREEVIGSPVKQLTGPETEEADMEQIREAVRAGQPATVILKSYRRDETPFWNHVSLAPVKNDKQQITHFTAIMTDISEKKEQENRLAYQATHDVLTGLGNRSLFEDRLEHDFALARRNSQQLAVLFIDLDEFKPINDTLGHKVGDGLLISIARRLDKVTRPEDTLARFGGDEFVLLLPDLTSPAQAEEVANRILDEIADPHQVGSHELYISASIGISLLDEHLDSPEKLIQQADMAMYKAKQQGRDTCEVYSEDLDTKLSKRVALRNELQEAIKTGQLFLNYQPQVDRDGQLCGLEALVRWKHPKKGLIAPADFIPVAEETGQIAHLGKWVTTQACKDARRLLEMGLLKGRMAVNLSPLQFHRPGFLTVLRSILEDTGLAPEHLELELTEGILMKDSEGAIDILNALNGMGVATAIDDFGTGFSSFSYLKDLPVDNIKIDRSFVDNVTTNEKDAAVCKGVITLAREMGLNVVAEGVETQEQFCYLKSHGCESFQGYYFARPMLFEDLVQWIGKTG